MTPQMISQTLRWASDLKVSPAHATSDVTPQSLKRRHYSDLVEYFRLCAISRAKRTPPGIRRQADQAVFRTRAILEHTLAKSLPPWPHVDDAVVARLAKGFFGVSKKQGVSVRMPLTTCMPSALCAAACYAHDVLDAAAPAIVRGAINGWLAEAYETGNRTTRQRVLASLAGPVVHAVRAAIRELQQLPIGFSRRPYIRFSHVGEIAAYPHFANAVAETVKTISRGEVDCVVYTRHANAAQMDPLLWVVNFTLDPASEDRRGWAPPNARVVYSAFGGKISDIAAVNFLEHHRHAHLPVAEGNGNVCPATLPETRVRTCDACECKLCFETPQSASTNKNDGN